ncbi:MAG TPA: homocysteine S-methyltransferase family protein [Noviherbaspirillum sp.]|uniref:homocysteine S-methyltransferase family protein n=1 Tax=Noviherbaspirillum sp. TaxID=1926288 RepID=UPI002F925554
MSKYRHHLPQLDDRYFMTDGGLETTLIFHEGIDLPHFASFDLLKNAAGTRALESYFRRYAEIARQHECGVVLEAATWRANPDWGARLGYDAAALAEANRRAIALLERVRAECETASTPIVISGNLGPRGDGYRTEGRMTARQSRDYHARQIEVFAGTSADMVAAFTMTYPEEATGIVGAASAAGMPVAISFTLETDGRLPCGDTLQDAIARTDDETGAYASYYMINCTHPSHFEEVVRGDGKWLQRVRGLRANASRRSHAELDEAPDLDDGNPEELGQQYKQMCARLPSLRVVGGGCGTDHRHLTEICNALLPAHATA